MDIQLSDSARKWQQIARKFADDYLQPHEIEAELNDGKLPDDIAKRNKSRAIELGFPGLDAPKAHGGLGLSMVEQVAFWEQLGRVTNALSWCFPEAQNWMFEACSDKQLERYILPLMRGERKDCYAITESGPGSDIAGLEATAVRDGDDYVLNGEKWYVTSGNIADFFWFQARLPDEDDEALFFVTRVSMESKLSRRRCSATLMHRTIRPTASPTCASRRPTAWANRAPAWLTRTAGSDTSAS